MQPPFRRKNYAAPVIALAGAALAVCSTPSFSKAVEADTTLEHMTLDKIVITDSAVSETISVIGAKTIEKGRNATIPDAIRNEPDITISQRASIGDTKDIVSIRGLSTNRIELDINGRPVNAAGVVGGYYIDWGTIPLDNIEQIEIIRGGSSALYGNNNLGGVINVITKAPTEQPEASLYGNTATGSGLDLAQNYRFTHSWKIGAVGYSLGGSYQKADAFLWNNDFEGKNFNINTAIDMPLEGSLSLGLQYSENIRGYIVNNRKSLDPDNPGFYQKINGDFPLSFGENLAPPFGRAFTSGAGSESDKTKYYMDLGYEQPIGEAVVEFKLYKNIEDRDEKNYSVAGLVPGYGDGTLVLDQSVASDRSYGGSLKATLPLAEHEIIGGIQYKVLSYGDIVENYIDTAYNGKIYTGSKPNQEAEMIGYFIQDSWNISDTFILTPGLRYDTYKLKPLNGADIAALHNDSLTPKLTATYGITAEDKLTASLYQSVRTPGLPEMYWWANGKTQGNPTLKPEKNNAAELIYRHDYSETASTQLSTYYYDIKDYIIFRNDPNWRGVYNIDEMTLYGASVEQRMAVTSWLSGRASLSYQKSKKDGDTFDNTNLSDELDFLPEWKGLIGADFQLPYRMILNADLRFSGDRTGIYAYTDDTGSTVKKLVTVDSSLTCNLNVQIPVSEHGEANLFVENLFNTNYEETYGYPLPGTIIGVSFKWIF
ncbi:TonB-dependent siderophore receptor [Desulfopila sp. IMCC35006]|uniref:TonB-dependent receptor plug domain-containing protein n=1 Tax=Desulfopila sp. IMCC35006 TaxID=2569542 RepID=UPI00142EC398|nr:TonB-dependent receptor [Desulfopila sp. IMCC35006]